MIEIILDNLKRSTDKRVEIVSGVFLTYNPSQRSYGIFDQNTNNGQSSLSKKAIKELLITYTGITK